MKKISIVILFFISFNSFSQNVGIGTTSPDASAKLDVTSTNSGFLPPRMTTTERNAIVHPAVGLQIYNLTTDCLEIFGRGKWNPIYCIPIDTTIVTDIDGQTYPTVQICNQTWMAKNLDVAHYSNGEIIPQVTDPTEWANLTTGAWCWYNNDSATYGSVYGRLYNWYAVNDPRGLAPLGWHVPSDAEWNKLVKCLDVNADTSITLGDQSPIAGGALKEEGLTHWISPNLGATNSSEFTALPGGNRDPFNGIFATMGNVCVWWSSSLATSTSVWVRYLYYYQASIAKSNLISMKDGFSVRCVKDLPASITINDGLVAYYPFNGNAGDSSGNGNHGTVNGAINYQIDRNGNSLNACFFNGASFIEIPSLNNLQYKPISYSVWINPASLVIQNLPLGDAVAIMGRDLCGQGIQGQMVVWNNPRLGINQQVDFWTGGSGFAFNYSPSLNNWTHLVFTWDENDSMRLYANGNLIQSQYYSSAGFLPNGIIPFRIGAGAGDCNTNNVGRCFWNGFIDDIRIYNRPLTQSEVTYLATH